METIFDLQIKQTGGVRLRPEFVRQMQSNELKWTKHDVLKTTNKVPENDVKQQDRPLPVY